MRAHAVRRIPVLRDERAVGIVAYDDVVLYLGGELQALGAAMVRAQRGERRAARADRIRDEASARLDEVSRHLGHLGDQALARIGREIESLRARLRGSPS